MAAEAYELTARRQIDDSESPSAATAWQVIGATDYADARSALDAVLPTSFTFPSSRVAYIDSVNATELLEDEFWEFAIGYRSQAKPTFNETEFEFDVAADNETIYQSLATQGYARPGNTVPNFNSAIGIGQGDGPPRGISPLNPASTFTITKHWAVASVTQAYQQVIENLVGKVCNATFQGRPAGTVRLLGVNGRQSGDKFPIAYQFGYRPNRTNVLYPNAITVASIKGWEVTDVYYERIFDSASHVIGFQPRAVYVHRIHEETSFAGLNI